MTVLEEETARVVAALTGGDRHGHIPWSDDWTADACAQHLSGAQRWCHLVVLGRPDADWSVRGDVELPSLDDPAFPERIAESAADLAATFRSLDPAEPCWTWWPERQDVGFWARRMAHETLVHRWDVEQGAGVAGPPIDPALASDGIDELLDVFVGMTRFLHTAPGAGETFHVHCTDTDGEWLLAFTAPGERELRREHAKGDVAFRGRAEDLLLFLWGRTTAEAGAIDVLGDPAMVARWSELAPSM